MEHLLENLDFGLFGVVALLIFGGLHAWLRVRHRQPGIPWGVWPALLGVLACGGWMTDRTAHRTTERLTRSVIGFAPTYALELERLGHAAVTLETPADDPRYLALIDAQKRWLHANLAVNDLYTFRRADPAADPQLIVDSETDYDRDGRFRGPREMRTAIGERLEILGPVVEAAYRGQGGMDPEPYTDRWGTWVSAYWPMHDARGQVEAVLGVDYDARAWASEIGTARLGAIVGTAAVLLVGFAATLLLSLQRMELQARQRTADAMREARDAAESASALKSQFLACMSHEIRTPMNGVMGVTELLLGTALDDQQRHFGNLIYRSATTLLNVINDILDYSKIEADKLVLEQIEFDPRETLEDVGELMGSHARAKTIELILDVPVESPRRLRGDAARLRQVLNNLVGNAIKFTDKGEVTVAAGWKQGTSESVTLRCEVRDTGAGIPLDAQANLFKPFVQADSSITRRYGGTGLGLVICKRLIELMGGTIGYASTPGAGSTFWFEVPFQRASDAAAAQAPVTGARALHGMQALIVDDNPTNREILEHTLTAWGLRHHSAPDADAAMEAVTGAASAQDPFDIVILDLNMPKEDGLRLARRLRQVPANANLQMLMLSSVSDHALAADWRECGIAQYLTKPVRQEVLFRALCDVLNAGATETVAGELQEPSLTDPPTPHFRGRALLAEDNPVNQLIASEMLRQLGFEVDVVDDGRAAVTAVVETARTYDVLFMDCEMPILDGRAATAEIRALERARPDCARLPIIALTAHAMDRDREACLAAGMDDYLSKPLSGAQLAATVARWLSPVADAA